MKSYTLQAKSGSQITSTMIFARDEFNAKVIASTKINAFYAADKRYAKGEITLKDPEGKVVWLIPSEELQMAEPKPVGRPRKEV